MPQHIVKQPNGKYAIFSSVVDHFIAYDATPEQVRNHFRQETIEVSDRATQRGLDRADGPHSHQGLRDDLTTVRRIHGADEADKWTRILTSPPCLHDAHSPAIVHRSGGTSAALRNRCGICGLLLVRDSETDPWVAISEADEDSLAQGFQAESAAGNPK